VQSENPWYIATAELAEMLFPEAGEIWLASRTPYISPKTFHEYELNLRTLGKAFGETNVQAIAGHVSRRMMQRYSHIRSAAKRSAVCGLYSSSGEVFKGTDPRVLLPENTLTNEVVLDMFRSEVPAEIIAAKIKMASAYYFDVSVGTIKQMRSTGVPDQIILAEQGPRSFGLRSDAPSRASCPSPATPHRSRATDPHHSWLGSRLP
jgi:hypothetical protein